MRTRTGLTAAALRNSELYGIAIKALDEPRPFADEDLEQHLWDAETFYQRELGIRFGVTRIASAAAARGLVKRTETVEGDYDEEEAAYAFPPDYWSGDRWGYTKLRKRPIVSVEQVAFSFPHPASIVFKLKPEWIRVDLHNGCFNIIPTSGPTILLQFNNTMLAIIGGAFTLPQSIVVDYTVGFTSDELRHGEYSDVLRAIRLRAAIAMLPGLGIALTGGRTSRSLALDGMSEGGGYQTGRYGPYSGLIEAAIREEKEIRESLLQRAQGLRIVVL